MSELKAVDKAFQLFHDKKYDKAVTSLAKLLDDDKLPAHIKARVKQFHQMARNATAKAEPESEDSLHTFTLRINEGDYEAAEKILDSMDAPEDTKLYLASELHIEQGNKDKAIELLKKAVELNDDNAGYALNSPSFAEHTKEEELQFLRSEPS